MKPSALVLPLTLALGIAVGSLADRFVMAQTTSPTRTMLLNVDMADMDGKEMKMWITELAPGAVTPKHYHPGHVVAYVLEGAVIHTVEGKEPITFSVGQAWHESQKDIHWGTNASAKVPVKFLAVQIAEKGQPVTVGVK
jgi:quercetin dioxygenase-like cupin family protein